MLVGKKTLFLVTSGVRSLCNSDTTTLWYVLLYNSCINSIFFLHYLQIQSTMLWIASVFSKLEQSTWLLLSFTCFLTKYQKISFFYFLIKLKTRKEEFYLLFLKKSVIKVLTSIKVMFYANIAASPVMAIQRRMFTPTALAGRPPSWPMFFTVHVILLHSILSPLLKKTSLRRKSRLSEDNEDLNPRPKTSQSSKEYSKFSSRQQVPSLSQIKCPAPSILNNRDPPQTQMKKDSRLFTRRRWNAWWTDKNCCVHFTLKLNASISSRRPRGSAPHTDYREQNQLNQGNP